MFISFLSTVYQLCVNFLSTVYQLFINLEEMITFDICIAARSYYVLGFTSCGRARVSAYSFLVSWCLLPRTSGQDAPGQLITAIV